MSYLGSRSALWTSGKKEVELHPKQLDVGADRPAAGRKSRTQCPNCRMRIRTTVPPLHCPRCLVRGMGRFELVALPDEGKHQDREKPARPAPGNRGSHPTALRIEQTVIWAESRQITVSGELDLAGADDLQHLLADTVGSGLPCIVLDLSSCRFLDPAALAVITELQFQLAANGQELVVHGAGGPARSDWLTL